MKMDDPLDVVGGDIEGCDSLGLEVPDEIRQVAVGVPGRKMIGGHVADPSRLEFSHSLDSNRCRD
jgi:hypothetical protein